MLLGYRTAVMKESRLMEKHASFIVNMISRLENSSSNKTTGVRSNVTM